MKGPNGQVYILFHGLKRGLILILSNVTVMALEKYDLEIDYLNFNLELNFSQEYDLLNLAHFFFVSAAI